MTGPGSVFSDGAVVRVRDDWPELHGPVHIRTPHYLRGKQGRVVRRLGAFRNPEDLAFARPAPTLVLYHVAFDPAELWPDGDSSGQVMVELYEHWLEAYP